MKKLFEFFEVLKYIRILGSKEVLERIRKFPYDSLTGLYNRRAVDEFRGQEAGYSVVFIDLDRFKEVNDQRGYSEGDRVLREFGSILKRYSRREDVFTRWGGDEFVVILPAAKKKEAESLIERIRERAEMMNPPLNFSSGVIESDGREDLNNVILRASKLMQERKMSC